MDGLIWSQLVSDFLNSILSIWLLAGVARRQGIANDHKVIVNRYEDIRNFEEYLYRNNVRTVKIFLNVSKDEQARRFLSRIEEPEKNWKFSGSDYDERAYWDAYQEAEAKNAKGSKKSKK